MTVEQIAEELDKEMDEFFYSNTRSRAHCSHDGECGGCPDFYDCGVIFGGGSFE